MTETNSGRPKLSKHLNKYITNTTTVEPYYLKVEDTKHD